MYPLTAPVTSLLPCWLPALGHVVTALLAPVARRRPFAEHLNSVSGPPDLQAPCLADLDGGCRPSGVQSTNPSAAIVVYHSGLPVLNLIQLGDSHMVVVEIACSQDRLYVVSMYCRFSAALEQFFQRIRLILSALQGKRVIL